jgi:glycosyltransferase involved in cell wall biosynthesis
LQRVGNVSLVLFPTESFLPSELDETKNLFSVEGIFPVKNTRPSWLDRIKKEFDPAFHGIRGDSISVENCRLFINISKDFDIVWFHTAKIPDALNTFRWDRSILDVDDLASQFYFSKAKSSRSVIRRLLDYRMSYIWRRRENLFHDRFDIISVCSDADKKIFTKEDRTLVIRNGYQLPENFSPDNNLKLSEPRIGFIGTLEYPPNLHGIRWFIDNVWPNVKQKIPEARLRLIGKKTDTLIDFSELNIDGLGWLSNVDKEIATWSAMIVPIHQGGGTRIKIAEGFARRCPVISTSIGAHGYNINNYEEALIADSASEFAHACAKVIKDAKLRKSLSECAFNAYLNRWTWDAQESAVSEAVQRCLDIQNK